MRAWDKDTGVFSFFFCSTGPDNRFWEFISDPGNLCVFLDLLWILGSVYTLRVNGVGKLRGLR